MYHNVRQLLDAKGHQVYSVKPDQPVYEALELMADKNIGAVAVVDDDNRLIGIMSERDYARKVVLMGKASRTTPIRDIMTERVYVVDPSTTIQQCLALMTERRFRHLPVIEDDTLTGFISIGDVVKAVIDHQKVLIDNLEAYIVG